ncbi:MAG: flavodoxin domain-containing protein [Chitinispirillales bacterium]|jgi:menaquinone-dependent protoporphyrinogen IX oxidase|nr:flavodoxin domain-containing protein [Chitinispirillales bacterium]
MKTVIIYKSKYGSTERYAKRLAEILNCQAINLTARKQPDLSGYDTVISGGGLYAGGIGGAACLKKQLAALKDKKIVVFTVGLADPAITDYKKIIDMGFSREQQSKIKFFHLRGSIDYQKLGFADKTAMGVLNFILKRKKESELSDEDKMFVATHGKGIDFIDKDTLKPIAEYVNGLAAK